MSKIFMPSSYRQIEDHKSSLSIQNIIDMYSNNNTTNNTIDYPKNILLSSVSTDKKRNISSNFNHNSVQFNKNEIKSFINQGINVISSRTKSNSKMKRDKTQIRLISQSSQNLNVNNVLPQINNSTSESTKNNNNRYLDNSKLVNCILNSVTPRNNQVNKLTNNSSLINKNYINSIFTKKKKLFIKGNIKINNGMNSKAKLFTNPNNGENKDIIKNPEETTILNTNNSIELTPQKLDYSDNYALNSDLKMNLFFPLSQENCKEETQNINDINNTVKFLRDISNDSISFEYFLQLLQCHIDLDTLITSCLSTNIYQRKRLFTTLSTDNLYKITRILNNYFCIINNIYFINSATVNDSFFTFDVLNQLFHKCVKVQMCLFSSILITITQLGIYEISTIIKNNFSKQLKDLSYPIMNLFKIFMLEEININYSNILERATCPNFLEKFNSLYSASYKINQVLDNSQIIFLFNKSINKVLNSMKSYSAIQLKYSTIKPYGDVLSQLISSIDKKPLSFFAKNFIYTVLYGELEINKIPLQLSQMSIDTALLSNNVNDTPPFLPPISNGYKYSLILDMDETLIHFFFTNHNGMFFVRPYLFDFLNELSNKYEIITFTAGTQDYADTILNAIDRDNRFFKYRLYRQHTSIMGINVYKDLSKIGRDLSKTIIIDNLKENYGLQPNNGLLIKTFTSDINDNQLRDLKNILKNIYILNVNDVRNVICKINEEIKTNKNIFNPYQNIDVSKYV